MTDPVDPARSRSHPGEPPHATAPPPPGDPAVPAATGSSHEPAAADAGVVAAAVGVIVSPAATLGQVTARPRIGAALGVAVVVLALTSIGNAADARGQAGAPFGGIGGEAAAVAGAVAGPLLGLGALALAALVAVGAARLLGGSGGYAATFCGMAFALVPWALTVVLPLLGPVAGFAGQVIAGVLTVAVAVWAAALAVLAVRSAQGLTTGRAVAALLAPVLALAVLIGLPFAFLLAVVVGIAALA